MWVYNDDVASPRSASLPSLKADHDIFTKNFKHQKQHMNTKVHLMAYIVSPFHLAFCKPLPASGSGIRHKENFVRNFVRNLIQQHPKNKLSKRIINKREFHHK